MPSLVQVDLPHHRYGVHVGAGLLTQLGPMCRAVASHRRAALIADSNVPSCWADQALASLRQAGYDVVFHAGRTGEENKTLDHVRELYDVLLNARLERKCPVIALGGGVTGDTVGFVAATYLRGVPFVQCPTTLLSMVDASVGGKVGVDVPQGKNLIGAFHQPSLVLADVATLSTLPPRQLRCGLAECVKHGVIRDASLMQWIARQAQAIGSLQMAVLEELVMRNVAIKAAVVMADEKESGERAHLNFGHTFAHAIESTTGFGRGDGWQHGEAVALGMVAATRLAVARRLCPADLLDQLLALLKAVGLPTFSDLLPPTDELIRAMRMDKKVADGRIRLVLPRAVGQIIIDDQSSMDQIACAWESLGQPA